MQLSQSKAGAGQARGCFGRSLPLSSRPPSRDPRLKNPAFFVKFFIPAKLALNGDRGAGIQIVLSGLPDQVG